MSSGTTPPESSADKVLARLGALHPKRIDLSLGRLNRLLAALGNPEKKLPPVIHVGGTNGKGSTVAFLRAMIEAAGKTTHVYTSPHLVHFNERIRLAGKIVSDDALAASLEETERANAGGEITFFEITTAAALLLFSRTPADVLLLEVGLGGRLDATNVIEHPLATVITPVSIDHVEYLGPSIENIAAEKAGIFKRGSPAVIAQQSGEALRVLERAARKAGAPLFVSGEQWHAHEEGGRLVYSDENGLLDLPRPRLFGRHQIENAGIAVATLRAIPFLAIPASAMEAGLQKADWPARMQNLSSGKLAARLPAGSELWLDGGHNAAGADAVAAAIGEMEERVPRPLVLIAGMLNTKSADDFLSRFSGIARHVFGVSPPGEASRPSSEIVAAAQAAGIEAEVASGFLDALDRVNELNLPAPPRVLITGSLYLAGEVLAANETPPG
ncbi:MAG: bifunctional folylpolyglutamate synthase/dihydrofolate synthase [Xanthobacteraceae bacterium]|nr:bifunctional folylpolyglutamate synthase/dihydrofolate synthase [Xanthobacteraceae bacterium]MCW5673305.1 bifunctional folylpolyglutamate synthase/dihydrofolate synthase [Xanthobacteraceae bacterium]